MKKMLLFALAVCPLLAGDGSMSSAERNYLLEQLEASKKDFLSSIQGVSAAQWKFKPAPAVWSVQECAEHIILAEDYIRGGAQQLLKTPASPRLGTATAEADQKFVALIKDRSRKATAPEPLVPASKFATPEDAAREFIARRDKTIAYVKSTDDDLRTHQGPGPAGTADAYQFLLLLTAHSSRHTAQIKEVEANAGYPKS